MRYHTRIATCSVCALAALILSTGPLAPDEPAPQPPADLSPPTASPSAWFAQVQRQVARDAADVEEADGSLWLRHSGTGLGLELAADGWSTLSPAVSSGGEDEEVGIRTAALRQGQARQPLGGGALRAGDCRRGEAREGCVRSAELAQQQVTTWWRHQAAGLEQGWTVEAPLGQGPLTVELEVRGGATAVEQGELRIGGAVLGRGLFAEDANGQPLEVDAVATADGFEITVETDDAAWPVLIDPVWEPWSWRKSGSVRAGFGAAVSLEGDINGDGYNDALVGAPGFGTANPNAGRAYLYLGGPTGLATTFAQSWTGARAQQRLGAAVAFLGDVDGDGDEDIALGSPGLRGTLTRQGAVQIFLGTGAGAQTSPSIELLGLQADAMLGGSLTRVGDVNGDGFDDVLAGIERDGYGSGNLTKQVRPTLFRGGPTLGVAAGVTYAGRAGYGAHVQGLGDVNSDGYDDFAIAGVRNNSWGTLHVYFGGTSLPGAPAFTRTSHTGVAAGDFNGDGWRDLLFYGNDHEVFEGGPLGLSAAPVVTVNDDEIASLHEPMAAGDLNGDGYDDLLIGSPESGGSGFTDRTGQLRLVLGSSTGLRLTEGVRTLRGDAFRFHLGAAVSTGDVDGDGVIDAMAGASGEVSDDTGFRSVPAWRRGSVYLISGGPAALEVDAPHFRPSEDLALVLEDPLQTVALADVSGDGRADLVETAEPGFTLRISTSAGLPAAADQIVAYPPGLQYFHYRALAICDVNGDGFGDLLASVSNGPTRSVHVYAGGVGGLASTYTTLSPGWGSAPLMECVGDVSGDGIDDAVMMLRAATYYYVAELFLGSPTGLLLSSRLSLGNGALIDSVAGGVDLNGDGIGDLVTARRGLSLSAWVGRAGGPTVSPNQSISLVGWQNRGARVEAGGDLNGDGFGDVLVLDSSTFAGDRRGVIAVLPGSSTGLVPSPIGVLRTQEDHSSLEGGASWVVVDLTGDGIDDLVLSALPTEDAELPYQSLLWVFRGGPAGVAATPLYSAPWGHLSNRLASMGDLDGDGLPEVALLTQYAQTTTGNSVAMWVLQSDGAGFSFLPPN
jgi:hypothetical protein